MTQETFQGYDLIGDIHGCGDELKRLLSELGYSKEAGAWRHPDRCAVFVGDLVDRGDQQREVVEVVKAMVSAGSALICAGNHELNAVGYATRRAQRSQGGDPEYLRPHTTKNYEQHEAFLKDFPPYSDHYRETIDWFKEIPLWLELKTSTGARARVIHACWDSATQETVKPHLQRDADGHYILGEHPDEELFTRGAPAFKAIEVLLKGREVRLPNGVYFADKSGIKRHDARVQWWADAKTWGEALLDPIKLEGLNLDDPLREEDL